MARLTTITPTSCRHWPRIRPSARESRLPAASCQSNQLRSRPEAHLWFRVNPSARRQTAPRPESDLSFRRPSGARPTPALLGRFYQCVRERTSAIAQKESSPSVEIRPMLRHEDDSPKDLPFAGSWLAPAGSRARTDGRDRDGGRDRRRSWRPSFREAAGHIRRRPSALLGPRSGSTASDPSSGLRVYEQGRQEARRRQVAPPFP